ncbi:MAG: hypothetical protein KME46_17675 [Brasilonema angustatum HA4187-MV1]|jgi:hypothetical protein|nr:hypothetical protein [Brasilonema angustatum HA4187-MV1]
MKLASTCKSFLAAKYAGVAVDASGKLMTLQVLVLALVIVGVRVVTTDWVPL